LKLGFIDDFELAAFVDDGAVRLTPAVTDLGLLPPQQLVNHVIERWADFLPRFEEIVASAEPVDLANVRMRPPLPKPISMVCMAVNYMENGRLKEKPPPQAFFKNSHSVIGHGESMRLPDAPATIFEGEAELGLVIGKTATNVDAADAYDYVFGYLNFVDGSARGLSGGMGLPYFMKGQDDSAPLGPWVTTADEVADPMNLAVKQWNNGKVTHDYNTNDMAHDIPASIAFVTSNTTLEAGDVIALGTNHGGLHPLQDGDVVEQEIDGLGRLTFNVVDELKRTWSRETREERGKDGPAPQLTGKYAESS
jgi:2-keto-4-pentenoate hydratase/2-oxohepta-3-ene-1,7-dioic acid hydratase in catechol pathway